MSALSEDNKLEKEEITANLVSNLPVLRAALNMTQEDLAEKLGVTRQTIISIEKKKKKPSWLVIMAMLFFFITRLETSVLLIPLGILNNRAIDLFGLRNMVKHMAGREGK